QRYGKFGSGHPDLVPYQAFPASDGHFIVACLTNAFFKRLCAAIGREDLLADPRFTTNDLRVQHRTEIVPILTDVFRARPCDHWIALLESHDIPACRVNMLEDILAHPQIAANGTVVEREGSRRGRIRTLGPPARLAPDPGRSAHFHAASCCHSGTAVVADPLEAPLAIEGGLAHTVLCCQGVAWGSERRGNVGQPHAEMRMKAAFEIPFGWYPQIVHFAGMARRHMELYGTTEAQLGAVAVACRRHAALHD